MRDDAAPGSDRDGRDLGPRALSGMAAAGLFRRWPARPGGRLEDALIESDVARLQLGEDWRMDVTDDQGRLLFRLDITVLEFRQPGELAELQGAET